MGRGIFCGAPMLVILMTATMPAMACRGQAATVHGETAAPIQRLMLRQHGGDFLIEAPPAGKARPAQSALVPLGRTIRLDPHLLAQPIHGEHADGYSY